MARVLHLLSQRPGHTGSGTTLEAIVHYAGAAGWDQLVSVGIPAGTPVPTFGGLADSRVRPLLFGSRDLRFDVPGMSDVMPYKSSRFSCMSADEHDAYRGAWVDHLGALVEEFQPDVIHSHHLWIMSSLVKDVAPDVPMVMQCHATGLRQMELCPDLAPAVREGCARSERFVVQNETHACHLSELLAVDIDRVHIVGPGYRDDVFCCPAHGVADGSRILYAGKYSASKGVPWLLDAVERLQGEFPDIVLHVAGSGAGDEAEELRARMERMANVVLHGMVSQAQLAELMRGASVFVLPSFYEGIPLVLIEALACGCRVVSTALPGVVHSIAEPAGTAVELVPLPRLEQVDRPIAEDTGAFVENLAGAISRQLARATADGPGPGMPESLRRFRWSEVFTRIESAWRAAMAQTPR